VSTYAGIILNEARLVIRSLGLTGKKQRAELGLSSREIAARKGVSEDLIDKWIHAARQLQKNDHALYRSALKSLLAGEPLPDLPASSRLRELNEHVLGLHGETRRAVIHNVLTTPARRSDRAAGNKLRYPADPFGAQALRSADQYAEMLRSVVEALNTLAHATRKGAVPVSDALARLNSLSALGDAIVKVACEIRGSIVKVDNQPSSAVFDDIALEVVSKGMERASCPLRSEDERPRQNHVQSRTGTTVVTVDVEPIGAPPSAMEADRTTGSAETVVDSLMSTTAAPPEAAAVGPCPSGATLAKKAHAPDHDADFVGSMRFAEEILAGRNPYDLLSEARTTLTWAQVVTIIGGARGASEAQSVGESEAVDADRNAVGPVVGAPALKPTVTPAPRAEPSLVAPRAPEWPRAAAQRSEPIVTASFAGGLSDARRREFEIYRALRNLAEGPGMTGCDSARARLRALGMTDGEIEAREAEAIANREREYARAIARLRG
jgi:hypothetical protein